MIPLWLLFNDIHPKDYMLDAFTHYGGSCLLYYLIGMLLCGILYNGFLYQVRFEPFAHRLVNMCNGMLTAAAFLAGQYSLRGIDEGYLAG